MLTSFIFLKINIFLMENGEQTKTIENDHLIKSVCEKKLAAAAAAMVFFLKRKRRVKRKTETKTVEQMVFYVLDTADRGGKVVPGP